MKPLLTLIALGALCCGPLLAAQKKPLKVFLLAGQSNMRGRAKVSTFEHVGMDPATRSLLDAMPGADGKPRVCERVWISSIGCAGEGERNQTAGEEAGKGGRPEAHGGKNRAGEADGRRTHRARAHGAGEGVSNAEFHHLGAAKILGGIGKALAEALAELNQLKPAK